MDTRLPEDNTAAEDRRRLKRQEEFDQKLTRLKALYQLVELRVASPYKKPANGFADPVAQTAARLFNDLVVSHGKHLRIGIGGGTTMKDMAGWLDFAECDLTFSSINYATSFREGFNDDWTLDSNILSQKFQSAFRRSRLEAGPFLPSLASALPYTPAVAARMHPEAFKSNRTLARFFHSSLECDLVFLGVGNFEPGAPTISRVYQHLGIDFDHIAKKKAVGDINLCYFDDCGNDLTADLMLSVVGDELPEQVRQRGGCFVANKSSDPHGKAAEFCHPFLVGMNIAFLKDMVSRGALRRDKTVVLVAGGGGVKTKAIQACLRHKIVNALVTDEATVNGLLGIK